MKIKYFTLVVSLLCFFGCQSDSKKESPTAGTLDIMASETVYPVASQMGERFEDLYPDSRINVIPTTASEAVQLLLNDSVEVVMLARQLNKDEETFIQKNELKIGKQEIAIGGLIVIVNEKNPINGLRVSQIDSIFKGYTHYWKDLGWKNTENTVLFFVPHPKTDIFDFINNQYLHGNKLPQGSQFVSSVDSIITSVSNNLGGIGIVGFNYNDTKYSIKSLEMSDYSKLSDSLGVSGQYFSPAQAYVYRKHYPLRASVYIYSNIQSVGLASGFVSFAMSIHGQKIVMNNKLVPATLPVRIVQLNSGDQK